MSLEQQQLQAAITALQGQRGVLGDDIVDALLAPARAKLAVLLADDVGKPAQTLRQVSILFLDVVGSTQLSQRLDPESVSAVMDGALARGARIVEAHQGKVLQFAGDNILAAFGADEGQEDDAERAVRCGLALLELGQSLGAEVLAAHGHAGFDVRVGVHTGTVLLGGAIDAPGAIHGASVNIAARMEQTAPAGALRISHDTYALVRGLFEVSAQDPLAVKGVDAPVQSYLVNRAKPRSFRIVTRGIEGVATRMVGRDAELRLLQDAFDRVFAERRLTAVTVVADAGIGKSRLLNEFEAWSEVRPEEFYVFRGRAAARTQGQPFGLLRDILAWRLQIADDDTLEVARGKVEQGVVPLFLHDDGADAAEGHAHLLGHLIGIEWRDSRHVRGILNDPKQIRNRALHAAAQMFRRFSTRNRADRGTPIVLQLEDLHWADNESLDFLTYLADVNRDVPMLMLSLSRPTLFERRGDWRLIGENTGVTHQRIDLAPLDSQNGRQLANELLKKLDSIPLALCELLADRAEGNPFYMEELVNMLIDEGAIRTGERWTLDAGKLLAAHVPATLTGVLQARLDGLPAAERLTLQEASVIGQVFWDQVLIALDVQARHTLPELVRRDLTLPRADAESTVHVDGLREYAFKHAILHQVTYNTVLKRTRRELHGKLARWLAAQTGLRANDFLGITAEHYEQAGDKVNAAEFHARAAEYACSRFAHDATLSHVQQALDLLDPGSDALTLRWRLLDARERTLDLQGRRAEQHADIEALELLADALNDDRKRADAAYRRSDHAMRRADRSEQESAARRAMALAERAGDDQLRLLSLRLAATAIAYKGDPEAGKTEALQGLAEVRSLGLRQLEAKCLASLSVIASLASDVIAAQEFSRQSLVICRETGDKRTEAITLGNVGNGWLKLGDYVQARRDLEAALRLHQGEGDRSFEGSVMGFLSDLALKVGDGAGALRLARSSVDIASAVQARDKELEALLQLGAAELALGRHAAAEQVFERFRVLSRGFDGPDPHYATAGLARIALARGDANAALREIECMLAHAAGAEVERYWYRELELACYQVLAATGDPRAADWLHIAHSRLQARAATIVGATARQGYLTNVPAHREIVAAWSDWQRRSQGHDDE